MKVEANIYLLTDTTNSVKALASITIEESFVVTGIRVIEGQNGLFCSMPSKKNNKGEYKDICFPKTKESRELINNVIVEAYNKEIGQNNTTVEDQDFELPF